MTDLFSHAQQKLLNSDTGHLKVGITLGLRQSSHNYRRPDPVTSKEAGRAARKFINTDQSEILRALTSRPMATEEVSDFLGWNDSVRVCRRFADMIRAGLIERTNRNGRSAFRHRLITREAMEAA